MTAERYLRRVRQGPRTAATLGRRAPVAQLDRASVYGTEGQRFESSRARWISPAPTSLQQDCCRTAMVLRVRASFAGEVLTTPKSGKVRSVPLAPQVSDQPAHL